MFVIKSTFYNKTTGPRGTKVKKDLIKWLREHGKYNKSIPRVW